MKPSALKVPVASSGMGCLSAAAASLQHDFDVDAYVQAGETRGGALASRSNPAELGRVGRRAFSSACTDSIDASAKEIRLWKSDKLWKLFDCGDGAIQKRGFPYVVVCRPDLLKVLADRVLVVYIPG